MLPRRKNINQRARTPSHALHAACNSVQALRFFVLKECPHDENYEESATWGCEGSQLEDSNGILGLVWRNRTESMQGLWLGAAVRTL